jgi:hypothetical protein
MRKIITIILLLSAITPSMVFGQTATVVTPSGGSGLGVTNGSAADPICRFFNSMRYQVHYTVAELTAAGIPANSLITAIAWNVTEASGTLGNYTIRMANTTQANDNAHDAVVTTQVKNPFNYSIATGYNDIVLDAPFLWNGTSNLLVEVCTGTTNPYVTPYGGVQARTGYATTGGGISGSRSYRVDGGVSACATNTSTRLSTKPIIRLTWTPNSLCTGTPNAGVASISSSSGCPSTVVNLSSSGLSSGSGISYQWQLSPTGLGSWTNIAGATSATLSQSPSATAFYRLVTTCSSSGTTNNSNTVSYTVNVTACAGVCPIGITSLPVSNQSVVCTGANLLNSSNIPACGGASALYLGGNEALYTVVPTVSGNSTITYSGQTYSSIWVWSGSCPNSGGTCVGSVSGAASSQSLTVSMTAGTTYYIMFDTWPSPVSPCPGTFSITTPIAPPPPPANDNCTNATNLPCGISGLAGTTLNSVAEIAPLNYSSQFGVWYTFTGNGLGTTITANALWDHEVLVFSGSGCGGAYTYVANADNNVSGNESVTFNTVNGTTYFVYIAHWSTTSTLTGDFTISRVCDSAPLWQSTWVSMNTGSSVWCTGETRDITVTVTNSGTSSWTNASPDVNIGVKWNQETSYFVKVNANGLVSGATQTYTFSVTAPASAGFNNLSFDVVNEGNFWFAANNNGGGPGNVVFRSLPVTVVAAPNPVTAGADITVCSASTAQLNGLATASIINEQFENVANQGWVISNMSNPAGVASWFQGNSAVFEGQSGGYIGVNFNSTTGANTISNWLISPQMTINNGDVISFYTRNPGGFADRLQLRMSPNGASVNVGADANSVGDFTTLILDINPTLAPNGYPAAWTQYTATVTGLPSTLSGRIAFRYFVTNGGPNGANSDYVGIDNFTYSANVNPIWSPETGLTSTTILNPVTSPSVTTEYTLTASQMGCASSANVTVSVINPTLISSPVNGDMVWKGSFNTDWLATANWWQYNNGAYSAAPTAPTVAQNVIIPSNQTCVLNQPNTNANTGNAKSIRIENEAILTMGTGVLNVAEFWVNDGSFAPGTGTVVFTGGGTHAISGASLTHGFNNLIMNKNGEIILSVSTMIAGSLTLTNGRLNIVDFDLDLPSNIVNGGNANSYVKTSAAGVLKRNVGASAVNFPVGRSAYNPATLTNLGEVDKFSVRVIDNVTDNGDNAETGQTTSLAVVNRTWMIDEQSEGESNLTLRLNWNGAGEEINNFQENSAFIAHYIASEGLWDNIGGTTFPSNIIETNGITSFSPFTISSVGAFAPLPVELLSFSSMCQNEDVAIMWSTASENNSMYFVVELSKDALNWEELAVVPAAQFSTSNTDYLINHLEGAREENYYRLKQVDQNGESKYYNVIFSNCGSDAGVPFTFPNPSSGDFGLHLNGTDISGNVQLAVFNSEGKEISNRQLDLEETISVIYISLLDLQPGVYYLKMIDNKGKSYVVKHCSI